MANISLLLDTIKNAIYGRDMRLALHDAIETVNKDTETRLKRSGGTMTGGITMGANKVASSATPTEDIDYTNKKYVDSKDSDILSYKNDDYPECKTTKTAIDKLFDKVDSAEKELPKKSTATNIKNGKRIGSLKSIIANDAISDGAIALGENALAISESSVAFGKNSIAGSKCFNVLSFDDTNKSYTLDSVEGLAVGDVFSLKFNNIYDNKGSITAINGKVVTVDNYQPNEAGSDKYFRVVSKPTCGTTDFGIAAFAEGEECMAVGDNSHASGARTLANGRYAHTEGIGTVAHSAAHSEGVESEARGYASHTEGQGTLTSKPQSHAEGLRTQANGQASHAEGMYGKANGKASCVSGYDCVADGDYSEAGGAITQANGEHSRAGGYGCKANGKGAFAFGRFAAANGEYSFVRGKLNLVDNNNKYVEIVGNGDASKRSNAYTLDWNGNAWFAGNVEVGGKILTLKSSTEGSSKKINLTAFDDGSMKIGSVKSVPNIPNTLNTITNITDIDDGSIEIDSDKGGLFNAPANLTTYLDGTSDYVKNWYNQHKGLKDYVYMEVSMPITDAAAESADNTERSWTVIVKADKGQTFNMFFGLFSEATATFIKANSSVKSLSEACGVTNGACVMFKFTKLALPHKDKAGRFSDYVVYDVITLEKELDSSGGVEIAPDEDL